MLEGATVNAVRPMTAEEAEAEGGRIDNLHGPPLVLELDNGLVLYPSRDEEGNGREPCSDTARRTRCRSASF